MHQEIVWVSQMSGMSGILMDLRLPSVDTVLHNSGFFLCATVFCMF